LFTSYLWTATNISGAVGRTQIERLLHIGLHSPPLCVEALKLAIKALKQTSDVPRYKLVIEQLNKLAPDDPEAVMDEEWVEKTSRRVANSTEKIEADLKSYKHNLIKESIRVRPIDPAGGNR
jgi:COP9 signalosome complex subunit 1